MTGSAFLLNIPPISFFAFQIEKSEPRGNVTKNRRFIKNSFDVLLLFRFKVGHQMTPNGKPSPKLKIPCANNTCGFDPHHRHPKQPGIERFRAAFLFSENAAPQPPGHPVLPRGRLELDLLFQRPVCRRRRHRALAVAGAAAALNIFLSKSIDNCQCA